MAKIIGLGVVGLLFISIGIINFCGNISLVHWYHKTRLTEENKPKYAKCMGSAMILMGITMVVNGILHIFLTTPYIDIITLSGLFIGISIIIFAQFKYNKGIF